MTSGSYTGNYLDGGYTPSRRYRTITLITVGCAMRRINFLVQSLMISYLCLALVACGGGSSSSSTVAATEYNITATAGSGGAITPGSTTVDSGQSAKFTISVNSGYVIQSVTGCGGTLSGNTYTTAPATANCTVNASFKPVTYTVTASAGSGGTITPASTTISSGQTAKFTVSANSGYAIKSVTGCGGTLAGTTYTTGAVVADCAVSATFEPLTYTVTASGDSGGTITPPSVTVNAGQTTAFNVIANSGYAIQSVAGCSGALSGNIYTTGRITANCSVTAVFSPEWTWEGGSDLANQPGTYGEQGMPAPTNIPGARADAVSWIDANGNVWIFGGNGVDSKGTSGDLNDLWMYSRTTNEWTWEGGSDLANQPSVYGTQGVAAQANIPSARDSAVTWTDANGNFWMFGGEQNAALNNNLWMYSPTTGEWTFEAGYGTPPGAYGTKGVAAGANMPGARVGAVSWTDSNGNLWLFGGSGVDSTGSVGELNDLWMYSPPIHEWTWEGGSDLANQPGVYGTQGVAASTNIPGARAYAVVWTGTNGEIWMFGGEDNASLYNDLWMYSPATGEWTWESGSDLANQPSDYGTQGVAAAANVPGARYGAVAWTDAGGDLWMFGGEGDGFLYNDLWMYSPKTHEWTWERGSSNSAAPQPGVYGTRGVTSMTNMPGARSGAVAWADSSGNLWMFGGDGGTFGGTNDLWMYPKP